MRWSGYLVSRRSMLTLGLSATGIKDFIVQPTVQIHTGTLVIERDSAGTERLHVLESQASQLPGHESQCATSTNPGLPAGTPEGSFFARVQHFIAEQHWF